MQANDAANDIYKFGRFSSSSPLPSIYSIASQFSDARNTVSKSFSDEYTIAQYPKQLLEDAISGQGIFESASTASSASAIQRRIVAEATMVTMVLHVRALDAMYESIDVCQARATSGASSASMDSPDYSGWDTAVALLTGSAEGPYGPLEGLSTSSANNSNDSNGFLFYGISKYLCLQAGTCLPGEVSILNKIIMREIANGSIFLESDQCDSAEESLKQVEFYLQMILVDAVAHFAEQIEEDKNLGRDGDENWAEGFGLATALVPLMRRSSSEDADVIKSNLGEFGMEEGLKDGKVRHG